MRFFSVLLLAAIAVASSANQHLLKIHKNDATNPSLMPSSAACQSCLTLAEAKINVALNVVLNAIVIEGCGDLCSHVDANMTQHCEVVCFAKGLEAFIAILNKTMPYIDPFAYCELVMDVCPPGLENASATLVGATSTPASGSPGNSVNPQGTVFSTQLELDVESATGLGEVRVNLVEDSNGVAYGGASLVNEGLEPGTYTVDFTVDTSYVVPSPANDYAPQEFYPGTYTVTFSFCQSFCGSAYEESFPIYFGDASTILNVTAN